VGVVVDCAENVLKHSVNVGQHVVIPIAQYAVAVCFKNLRSFCIGGRSHSMLTTVDLHDDVLRVTSKIDDVPIDSNLAPKVGTGRRKPVAQMPPEFSFGFGRSGAHLASELALRRRVRSIAIGPGSWLVACGHIAVSLLRPPPLTPPHKGEGNRPSAWRRWCVNLTNHAETPPRPHRSRTALPRKAARGLIGHRRAREIQKDIFHV
jgi:hypothetical protein